MSDNRCNNTLIVCFDCLLCFLLSLVLLFENLLNRFGPETRLLFSLGTNLIRVLSLSAESGVDKVGDDARDRSQIGVIETLGAKLCRI